MQKSAGSEAKPSAADPSNDEEDLSYLKDWIDEEPPVETEPEARLIETEPEGEHAIEEVIANVEAESQPEVLSGGENETPIPEEDKFATDPDLGDTEPIPIQSIITPQLLTSGSSSNPPPLPDTLEESPADEEVSTETTGQDDHPDPLHYSCVLIPRDPQHFLTRSIAERLGLILPWIHASRGWRMTGIAIRPRYVQWSIALPAETSPVTAIQEVRKLASDQLCATFPELKNSENEQDFWAPGYLMVSGTQPIPFSMIQAFLDWSQKQQPGET